MIILVFNFNVIVQVNKAPVSILPELQTCSKYYSICGYIVYRVNVNVNPILHIPYILLSVHLADNTVFLLKLL